jgi:hypothetical protein
MDWTTPQGVKIDIEQLKADLLVYLVTGDHKSTSAAMGDAMSLLAHTGGLPDDCLSSRVGRPASIIARLKLLEERFPTPEGNDVT